MIAGGADAADAGGRIAVKRATRSSSAVSRWRWETGWRQLGIRRRRWWWRAMDALEKEREPSREHAAWALEQVGAG